MSFFVAKLEKNDNVMDFFAETRERNSQAMLENKSKIVIKGKNIYWVNLIYIRIPPIYWLFFIFLFLYLWLGGWGWFIPMAFFGLSYIVFWRGFHIWAFKKGLKRAGYKGEIIILSTERGVSEVLYL